MTFKNLVDKGIIKPLKATEDEMHDILSLADRDIKMANFVITQDLDWAFSISYNAALQASRAYMYSRGYRASGAQAHKNTFTFMKLALGKEHVSIIEFFDRMRPKRNRAIYDIPGVVTETEVKELLKRTNNYVSMIRKKLQ